VHTVNYEDQEDLQFILRGINLVISTIPRHAQLKLIDAAAHAGVSRFVPSEFEGSLDRRPRDDPLDPGQYHKATMSRLRHWSKRGNRMKSTVVTCGVFYERFAPGGMESLDIGSSTNISSQGSYLMDVGYQQALIVEKGNQQIWLNMTSANDVAYFLVAALELGLENWLPEFKIRGDQLSIAEVVRWGEYISKGLLSTAGEWCISTEASNCRYTLHDFCHRLSRPSGRDQCCFTQLRPCKTCKIARTASH